MACFFHNISFANPNATSGYFTLGPAACLMHKDPAAAGDELARDRKVWKQEFGWHRWMQRACSES